MPHDARGRAGGPRARGVRRHRGGCAALRRRAEAARWLAGPAAPAVGDEEVHVWRIGLDVDAGVLATLEATLDDAERARARSFRRPADAARFVAGRGAMRAILAGYAKVHPAALSFRLGAHGKPALAPALDPAPRFNLAHAEDLALLAVAAGREVGIDVEIVRPIPDAGAVAARWFAPEERAAVAGAAPAEVARTFFACWTRKEAFVKALGRGLSLPLDAFAVTAAPDVAPTLLRAPPAADASADWYLTDLPVAVGVAAALAVEGARAPAIHCWTWLSDRVELADPGARSPGR